MSLGGERCERSLAQRALNINTNELHSYIICPQMGLQVLNFSFRKSLCFFFKKIIFNFYLLFNQ